MLMNNEKKDVSMISKKDCTGCKLCQDVCKFNAIDYEYVDGFWYPKIKDNCVHCGRCFLECPVNKDIYIKNVFERKCYGVINKNLELRKDSTSGGFFSELATYLISQNWHIVGAIYDNEFKVVHTIGNSKEDIDKYRKSKYVQSDTAGIYNKVKKMLEKEEKVFFTGTPCQVASLLSYLGKNYNNLLTMDFICCGISSPVIFEKYKAWLEQKAKSKIKSIWFKNKENGWRSISTKVEFENGKVYLCNGIKDPYMVSFVIDGNNIRNSCYHCKYRKFDHVSDYTVGDFWGMESKYAEYDDNLGTTALMLNSKKGEKYYRFIENRFIHFDTTIENIAEGNFTLFKPKEPGEQRDLFLKAMINEDFDRTIEKYTSLKKRTIFEICKQKIKAILFRKEGI